ncbi:MAG: pleiotropic regulatory protein RsmS [Alteromonas sp.]|nr:pleiotropic regulatory protein RsmS [Alteromonas sp.]
MNQDTTNSLEHAPDDIKLAVDLIYLFENNEVDPKTALKALKIVEQDLQRKLSSVE